MTVELLPARYGDCILVECSDATSTHRILIDGGPPGSYDSLRERIRRLQPEGRRFDLLVITHVDADHIWGVLKLLEDQNLGCSFEDVWFNGFRHLPPPDEEAKRSLRQGEALTELLDGSSDRPSLPWNESFGGDAITAPGLGRYRTESLDWGLRVTLISPIPARLSRLWEDWDLLIQKAKAGEPSEQQAQPELTVPEVLVRRGVASLEELAATPTRKDRKPANGSSIAFLLEWGDLSCLLTGDAFPDILEPAIRKIAADRGVDRLPLDAFKLPHHGSMANVTRTLVESVSCRRYLFSTNGELFDHPDPEAVARVILFGGDSVALLFNYRTQLTARWDDAQLTKDYSYHVTYGSEESGLLVPLAEPAIP